jgi:uncharacterized membrane protein
MGSWAQERSVSEMTDSGYRKRLVEDLPRWREAGWVTAEGEREILASLETRRPAFGLAAIVGLLGALLLGAGVVAFVGANWEQMPRIVRFGLLVAAMAVAYGVAAMLAAREMRIFAEAALLVAGLVFAGAIALVGQTYHLSGDFADAILLWEIGVLGAALFTGSATLTVLALVGAGYWTWLNVVDLAIVPHWASFALILIGAAVAVRLGSHYTRLVGVVALAFWIAVNLVGIAMRHDWSPFEMLAVATTIALLFWAIGSCLATFSTWKDVAAFGHAMLWPGIGAALLAVGILQTAPNDRFGDASTDQWALVAAAATIALTALVAVARQRRGIATIDAVGAVAIALAAIAYVYFQPEDRMAARLLGGVIVIGAALWAINNGQTGPQRVGKTTGLAAFGIEIIYLYVVTIGTLMDTALAFLVGGVLFIALAYGLFRIDRRLGRRVEAAAEASP